MPFLMPRLVIAGLCGGSGKTTVSAGLTRALTRRGLKVLACKKGPDYIDTLWLSLAGGHKPRNLVPFMTPPGLLPHFFAQACASSAPDLVLIEGNRGLYDGQDLAGSCSTAELARLLSSPVMLVMNCTKMTRTTAALVAGCKHFEPDVNLAGVILNRVSRARHRLLVKEAVESLTGVPVAGMLPLAPEPPFAERYSGLYGDEAVLAGRGAFARLDALADFTEAHVDLEAVLRIARGAPPLEIKNRPQDWKTDRAAPGEAAGPRPRIGYVRDLAIWFYYTDNLEALEKAGAELVELSLLEAKPWPAIDGLYLGGGFPEDYAEALAANSGRKAEVARLIRSGLPTYAEGSGFYYLAENLRVGGGDYPMSGVLKLDLNLQKTPRGIGYVRAVVEKPNPFHPVGSVILGHEFHYADIGLPPALAAESLLRLDKGAGLLRGPQGGRDGFLVHNCFISHLQIFAPGASHWAPRFVQAARSGPVHTV
jgi:cobyrinic acid a,c-diamide synthase